MAPSHNWGLAFLSVFLFFHVKTLYSYYILIQHTKSPQKWLKPVCVITLMQVGAGLFVLLVESSSVSRLLKLIYLQPIIFCVDSGNLETRREKNHAVKWNRTSRQSLGLGGIYFLIPSWNFTGIGRYLCVALATHTNHRTDELLHFASSLFSV